VGEEHARFEAALAAEAVRVHDRYIIELVEALKICPWAERARLEGRMRQRVLLGRSLDLEPALEATAELGADGGIEVGFLIFPRVDAGRVAFERFVAELRRVDAARAGLEGPPMAMAAFHYDAEPDLGAPQRLVPFLRRSPDPTVQLIRRGVLDALRGPGDHGTAFVDPTQVNLADFLAKKKKPPLHERVAVMNLETVREVGLAHLEAILHDIRADRDAAYARLEARGE
jgi:hypothetical protein